jgi:hypothetical protein
VKSLLFETPLNHKYVCLWLCSTLLDLGRGISPLQCLYLHRRRHKHRINAHRHPCLKWDSNPRSQRSSDITLGGGARGSVVVKALCCKPEGRGFNSDEVDFFKIDLILSAALALGSTQPLTEMSTRNL